MSGEPVLPSDSGALPRPARRRRRWLLLAGLAILVAGGLAVGWRPRPALPEPPAMDLSKIDPEAAEAITAARNTVRQRPHDGVAWGRLGMMLLAHDFGEEANCCLQEAERLNPADARWPYLQGFILLQSDLDASIACMQRTVERCGNDPLAPRMRLAETLLAQDRLDEAQLHLEQARKAEPWNLRVRLGLGRLAMLRGQWRDAVEPLEACLGDVHARQQAQRLLAAVWIRLHEPDKARQAQQRVLQVPEDQMWPDPFFEGVLALQRGLMARLHETRRLMARRRFPQAVSLIEETVRRYPQSTEARLLLAEVRMRQGDLQRAVQACREAVRIDPQSAEAWFRLGCFQVAERPRDAAESFRKTIQLKPDHADAHFNLANRLKELGDNAGAAEEFRAALRARPDFERARQALRELEKEE